MIKRNIMTLTILFKFLKRFKNLFKKNDPLEKIYNVVEIIDRKKIIVNAGNKQGLKQGDKVVIFRFTDEDIIDIHTGKNWGKMEYQLGYGKVDELLKENHCLIVPDRKKVTIPLDSPFEVEWDECEWDIIHKGDCVRKAYLVERK